MEDILEDGPSFIRCELCDGSGMLCAECGSASGYCECGNSDNWDECSECDGAGSLEEEGGK